MWEGGTVRDIAFDRKWIATVFNGGYPQCIRDHVSTQSGNIRLSYLRFRTFFGSVFRGVYNDTLRAAWAELRHI